MDTNGIIDRIKDLEKLVAELTKKQGGGSTSPLTTKGDLYGYDTAGNRIPIGANKTILVADSTQALGLKWQSIVDAVYPVGAIYMSVVNTSPATLFGGTWSAWGAGRVPVGVDTGDTAFDTVEETGGAKTHQHAQGGIGGLTANGSGGTQYGCWNGAGGFGISSSTITFPNYSSDVATAGVGASVNVYPWLTESVSTLQPYITCYMWKRTA